MFKPTATILLIFIMILSQYGRQLAYLQCKFENLSAKTSAAVCDCEQDYNKDQANTGNNLPPQKGHSHISPDEYYLWNEPGAAFISCTGYTKSLYPYNKSLASYNRNIFHPPNC